MKKTILTITAAVVVTLAVQNFFLNKTASTTPQKESAYDRVIRTGTIRCGYVVWAPFFIKDPNTGKYSGIFYDYMEALGKALHLKIEWTEELGTGDFIAAINANRVEGLCSGVWPNATRAREADFTKPIYYSAKYVYVRSDDTRFNNNPDKLNDPTIAFVAIDGEMGSLIAANDFPKAKMLQLPQLTNQTELFTNVMTGKADAVISDPDSYAQYEANNPGKIRPISSKTPLRIFGNTIAIAQGQDRFRRMLDTATQELLDSGQIEKILTKYEKHSGDFLRIAPAFTSK